MGNKYISLSGFKKLLLELARTNEVFAPHKVDEFIFYKKISKDSIEKLVIGEARSHDSLKPLFFKSREKVASYFPAEKEINPITTEKILVGVKACDLAAISAQDKFFGTEPTDPFYLLNRKSALIISSDCNWAYASCFCTLVKLQPYAKEGFDLNLVPIEDGLLVEIGSAKGEDFISKNSPYFGNASKETVDAGHRQREQMVKKVEDLNKKYELKAAPHEILRITAEDKITWKELVRNCTECSACNRACPSCSCFLLYDQKIENKGERIKVWDHCLHRDYAKVAGGANPRAEIWSRYQNRLHCKFDYMLEQIGNYTCTGCGRCIEVCMAKIDMRQCLVELQKKVIYSATLE